MAKQGRFETFTEAGRAFGERRLWERFTNFDCIGLRLGARETPMLATIMGNAGEEFGLMLIRGDDPGASFETMIQPEGPGSDGIEAMDMMSLNLEPFGAMDDEIQNWFRQHGQHPKVGEVVPWPMAKPRFKSPGFPSDEDLALLTWAIRAIVKADTAAPLEPAELDDPAGICWITMDDESTDVVVTREPWVSPEATLASAQDVTVRLEAEALERLDTTYLVGTAPMPATIEGDDRSLQLLLVVDDANGRAVQARPVYAGDVQEAVDALLDAFHGRTMIPLPGGLPREIIFTTQALHDAVKPTLMFAGVTCRYEPSIPRLETMMANFTEFLIDHSPSEFGLEDDPDDTVPADDDLAAWKQADRNLAHRFEVFLDEEDRLWSSRATRRYLGHDELEDVLEEFRELGAVLAYCSWGVLDYRPTRKSKTQAEKMIEAGLPAAEEQLLQSRMATPPSLHRVEGMDPQAGTVEMEDILLGGTRTVHDQLFSENVDSGFVFVGRIFPAGPFHFMEPIGPPLGGLMVNEAIDVLRDEGVAFTPDGLLADAHKFGCLWAWFEGYRDNPPRPILHNTDGDLLEPHTASFTIDDEGIVRQALVTRDDVSYHEEMDEYTWDLADAPGAKTIGGPVLMARMNFVGEELIVEVNSARRLQRIRDWLDKIPGVRFLDVKVTPWDLPEDARPLDDRLGFDADKPMDFPPEMVQQLTAHLHQHYMDWLDTPLPVLHGKTPREACRTDAGKEEVAILIRTIPDPTGNAGVDVAVPRQAMLRELGLLAATDPFDDAPALPAPIHAPPKVGRNSPCPCGSGKKYKKCCGR